MQDVLEVERHPELLDDATLALLDAERNARPDVRLDLGRQLLLEARGDPSRAWRDHYERTMAIGRELVAAAKSWHARLDAATDPDEIIALADSALAFAAEIGNGRRTSRPSRGHCVRSRARPGTGGALRRRSSRGARVVLTALGDAVRRANLLSPAPPLRDLRGPDRWHPERARGPRHARRRGARPARHQISPSRIAPQAARLGVPHLRLPAAVPARPFGVIRVLDLPGWHERALWWPERRVLVVAEVVGTNGIYRLGPGRRDCTRSARAAAGRAARLRAGAAARRPRPRRPRAAGRGRARGRLRPRSRRDLPKLVLQLPAMARTAAVGSR